ncbi:MAG TPA: DUF6527 family protein [Candidatus Limnocylindrales bacterium]
MSRVTRFEPRFVKNAPAQLEDGVVYVSIEYSTVLHLCACGCRNEVVTRLDPEGWALTYDGVSASLYPSIGNWNFPCRSHYWIRSGGRVEWAPAWSDAEVGRARREAASSRPTNLAGLWSFLRSWFRRDRSR